MLERREIFIHRRLVALITACAFDLIAAHPWTTIKLSMLNHRSNARPLAERKARVLRAIYQKDRLDIEEEKLCRQELTPRELAAMYRIERRLRRLLPKARNKLKVQREIVAIAKAIRTMRP